MPSESSYEPLVTVVGFHHARGPEIESWFGIKSDIDPATENDWPLLPFMALSDGAHTSTEEFSYFTLKRQDTTSSLFGISCSRQMDAKLLINRPADVTRSTVQKAVVVITDEPQHFGQLREKLSAVTGAWFAQRNFTDTEILKHFQESLVANLREAKGDSDQYFGLSLREMIHEFKHQTLILFKCLLLQPKMLFFGSRCERLCMIQFSLISLIPGLLRSLQDSADPAFDDHEKNLVMPTTLKTSERSSLLAYMGLPLQVFGKGAFFGPYTPLQQLDLLADYGTKSYVVGSTNSLLLQQKDHYSDILINLDEVTVNITSTSLRTALSLSAADRRWIDFLAQTINDTWDDANPSHPKDHKYIGSEEFIRLQFEEYLLALLSSAKYQIHLSNQPPSQRDPSETSKPPSISSRSASPAPSALTPARSSSENPTDSTLDFNPDFFVAWRSTPNYQTFARLTTPHLFDIVVPRHPCAGGLTIDDVQRRLAQQVSELHLDERVREGREVLNKHLATGQKRLNTAFNNFWADIESMREVQRKKRTESSTASSAEKDTSVSTNLSDQTPGPPIRPATSPPGSPINSAISRTNTDSSNQAWVTQTRTRELSSQAQATAQAASQKASAYLSSWSSWASDKKKDWDAKRQAQTASTPSTSTSKPGVGNTNPSSDVGVMDGASDKNKRKSGAMDWSSSIRRSLEEKDKQKDSVVNGRGEMDERGRTSNVTRD